MSDSDRNAAAVGSMIVVAIGALVTYAYIGITTKRAQKKYLDSLK